jgi:hypothetical protein
LGGKHPDFFLKENKEFYTNNPQGRKEGRLGVMETGKVKVDTLIEKSLWIVRHNQHVALQKFTST